MEVQIHNFNDKCLLTLYRAAKIQCREWHRLEKMYCDTFSDKWKIKQFLIENALLSNELKSKNEVIRVIKSRHKL